MELSFTLGHATPAVTGVVALVPFYIFALLLSRCRACHRLLMNDFACSQR